MSRALEVYDMIPGSLNISPEEFGTALFKGGTLSPRIGLLIDDLFLGKKVMILLE